MSTYSAKMQGKVNYLRRKYQTSGDKKHNDILSRILWYSIPVVYTHHMTDTRVACNKLDAVKRKRARYRAYVRDMLTTFCRDTYLCKSYDAYLVSLTFMDEYYCSNSRKTRDKYARDYLNSVSADYFACLDIGKENGREHYHAIIVTNKPLALISNGKRKKQFFAFANQEDTWRYGFYSLRPLKIDKQDLYRTMNYALKSSDYAFKSADVDTSIKPFHKRGVEHYHEYDNSGYDTLPF